MNHNLEAAIAVIAGCVLAWGLVSVRLERWDVTAPLAFVVMGLVVTHGPVTLIHTNLHSETIRSLAEVTLALVLFADASRVNVNSLRANLGVPARLLCIGLPVTIGVGFAVAAGLFSGVGLWVAAALGAIVAPTDAALGASMMQDERVPVAVRQVLNVESGLNDGIATPFVNLFLAGAVATEAVHGPGVGQAAIDLIGGAAIGVGIGIAGALLLRLAARARWSEISYRPLSVCALALLAYEVSLLAGTNGFVAAFVSGMAFGAVGIGDNGVLSFAEEVGTLLSLVVWFFFGAVMLVPGLQADGWREAIFAVLALTVVRMGPVALALVGSGLDGATVAFIGWFGPRGLASIVFGLIAVDSLAPAPAQVVLGAVTLTVALSVLLHGVSASPLARRYGLRAARSPHDVVGEPATQTLPSRRIRGRSHFPTRRRRHDRPMG
jgi:sodium/hydrogen antiporter